MIAYASRTGTKRNLAELRKYGFRLLVSATGDHRTEGWTDYALDNGAWTAYNSGVPFRADRFRLLLDRLGAGADWVVVPDIVAGGLESLAFSLEWLDECLAACPRVLIGVQDGMVLEDVEPYINERVGIAIGGTTEWKLEQLRDDVWGRLCHDRGAWLHCLRVNTIGRIADCESAGCHSFDGTSATRWAVNIPKLARGRAHRSILAAMRGYYYDQEI